MMFSSCICIWTGGEPCFERLHFGSMKANSWSSHLQIADTSLINVKTNLACPLAYIIKHSQTIKGGEFLKRPPALIHPPVMEPASTTGLLYLCVPEEHASNWRDCSLSGDILMPQKTYYLMKVSVDQTLLTNLEAVKNWYTTTGKPHQFMPCTRVLLIQHATGWTKL